ASHELRTPLTSIRGYVELLEDAIEQPDPAAARRMLDVVGRNTVRLQGLVEDMLTLSRLDANALTIERRPVELRPVVAAAVAAVAPLATSGSVELLADDVPPGIVVLGDARQLERVVLNLLSNAIKFTPAGGQVAVRVAPGGGEVALSVADTGIGIPPEEQAQLGQRFFRASNAGANSIPGTGLGLRIVFGLVEQHGGRVDLASTPGSGTTFTVHLPLAEARGQRAAGSPPLPAGVSPGR
ncbi:MAG TPA: ATP-binding protein, partial [Acidimicrobiales bacterium]|nr:ATP-binding protein [Acidimicrobiales bacterium]